MMVKPAALNTGPTKLAKSSDAMVGSNQFQLTCMPVDCGNASLDDKWSDGL